MSLIILGITVIVIAILSGIIIGSLSKNNTMNDAKKVKVQNNVTKAREELESYILAKQAVNPSFSRKTVNAMNDDINNRKLEFEQYIKNPSEEVVKYLIIKNGTLYIKKDFKTSTLKEIEWIRETKIKDEI